MIRPTHYPSPIRGEEIKNYIDTNLPLTNKGREKKITVGELLLWFKRYERFVQADAIDAEPWRGEFLDFVMYLVNNLDDKE